MQYIEDVIYSEKLTTDEMHQHFYDQMFFVVKGHADLTIGQREYAVNGPAMVFIGQFQPHRWITDNDCHRYFVNINRQQAQAQLESRAYLLTPFGKKEEGVLEGGGSCLPQKGGSIYANVF